MTRDFSFLKAVPTSYIIERHRAQKLDSECKTDISFKSIIWIFDMQNKDLL